MAADNPANVRTKAVFVVPRMDCAAEEQLVRMALAGRIDISQIDTDIRSRQVSIVHDGDAGEIAALLAPLNLGAQLISTTEVKDWNEVLSNGQAESRTLKQVLAINASMFVAEIGASFIADSSALFADSLDMFADATVYGIALFSVQRPQAQLLGARVSGILQLSLAVGALIQVMRRLVVGSEPEAPLMAGMAAIALAANMTCLWLLARYRTGGAHMKASWIFTTNDVIANLGVIAAAALVRLLQSHVPDLVVATIIAFVVLTGALRILRLRG